MLRATGPMIGLDPRGRIRQIRFNGRSLAPVRLPAAQARAFYAAYRAFAELAADPEAMVTARLAPGDCVIFDNTRILHGRTAFADGEGHTAASTRPSDLQGCYADLDGWHRRRGGPGPRPGRSGGPPAGLAETSRPGRLP